MFSFFVIPAVIIIGAWYAAAWLRNGWWLWLIIPALPPASLLAIVLIWKIRVPEAEWGFALVLESVGISVGIPVSLLLAVIVAGWTRYKLRRARVAS